MAKRVTVSIGDLFLIPRKDGKFVLGQIVEEWMKGVVCIAVFDVVVSGREMMSPVDAATSQLLLSLPSVAKAELSHGHWKIVGNSKALVDIRLAPHNEFKNRDYNGAVWHSGGMVEKLVDAYYGMGTWEPYPGRPGQLKSLLLSQAKSQLA